MILSSNMPFKLKRASTWFVIGLAVVTATAYGAPQLFTPKPPISPAPTADELYQQEFSVAQRTCDKVNRIIGDGTVEGPFTASECIEPNRSCEKRRGPHSVWAGAADSDNVPICSCDEGYIWVNIDETTGTSYGPGLTLDTINAPGRCVARQ